MINHCCDIYVKTRQYIFTCLGWRFPRAGCRRTKRHSWRCTSSGICSPEPSTSGAGTSAATNTPGTQFLRFTCRVRNVSEEEHSLTLYRVPTVYGVAPTIGRVNAPSMPMPSPGCSFRSPSFPPQTPNPRNHDEKGISWPHLWQSKHSKRNAS